jgi:hypothetical protein
VLPQLSPAGPLLTNPPPLPVLVTVRVKLWAVLAQTSFEGAETSAELKACIEVFARDV